MSDTPPFDTSPGGIQRLYYRVVMIAVASVLALDGLLGWIFGQEERVGLIRLLFYGAILLFAWFAHEMAGDPPHRTREPRGVFLSVMGLISVVLCIETGGVASAFYMLVFLTCVFGALVMRPTKAFLLTSVLCALYCLLTWVYPEGGILAGRFGEIAEKIKGGIGVTADDVNSLVVHCAFLFAGTWIATGLSTSFREKVGRLEVHAVRDPLTSLPNRRGFMDMLGLQIAKAVHWDWPVAILVLDLDHFKKVNDRFGHPVGDRVLAAAAGLLREAAGPLDNVARIGGEEFAVAAVGAEQNNAADLADRIVRSFRGHDWNSLQAGLHVTCSVGVAIRQPGREELPVTDLAGLIDEADRALLQVKQHGRNGYLVAATPTAPSRGSESLKTARA